MKKLRVFLICLLMLFTTSIPVFAEDSRKTVKIGYIDYDNFVEELDNGTLTGFAADYFKQISKYTGWKYEFVDVSWEDAQEQIKNGELDFYCVARRTTERLEQYDFSTFSLLNEPMNLYVNADTDYGKSIQNLDGKKVGMLAGSKEIENFQKYEQQQNINMEIVQYDSNEEACHAAETNEVQAAAVVSYSAPDTLTCIANFGIEPAYLMGQHNSELMDELNQAQEQLTIEIPEFLTNLTKKYFPIELDVLLSSEEYSYVQNSSEITVGFIPNRAPYSYVNAAGEIDGITKDIVGLLAERTGLKFKYVMMPAGMTVMEFLKENPEAIVTGIIVDNPAFT